MRWVGPLLFVFGCGGTIDTGLPDASPADAGGDTTVVDSGGDVTFDEPNPCLSQLECSADLHAIVDCQGNVVQTCPDDQGCIGNTCVPACQVTSALKHWSGCEFYSVVPDVLAGYNLTGGCYAVALTNTWTAPMTVTVERGGNALTGFLYVPSGSGQAVTYSPATQIAPGGTGLLFLSRAANSNPSCPTSVTPALAIDPAVHGTDYGQAFHITTSMPATAADYVPFGASVATASASVLLPVQRWAPAYMIVDAYVASQVSGGVPSTDIVATADNTTVQIVPAVDIVGSGTVAAATAGKVQSYSLSKGQVLQFTQSEELTGSVVQSNYPIGVWGAHTCMNIDPSTSYCDSGHQQIPAPQALGDDYVAVRYKNRSTTDETPPWRLVGLVDSTTLTWDPPVSGAPTTLSAGQLVTVTTAGPFRVTSQDQQHPFYLSAHMTGGGPYGGLGDPEFVNVVPTKAWRDAYSFFTQPAFPETSLVVVRSSANGGFQDVSLGCAGTLGGWTAVDSAGLYEYTRIDISTGNFTGQNGCDNGVQTATSTGPFTITAWGWGNTQTTNTYSVSYALPAGM
jgi:hypothetical protein